MLTLLQRAVACVVVMIGIAYLTPTSGVEIAAVSTDRNGALEAALGRIVKDHGVNTAAVAMIDDGELTWSGTFGMTSPGNPATLETLFDVGSITKTVTAETILRLVALGELDLDEPMSEAWIDPDLADDPNHHRLTPRMSLTHTAGFMNWRFFAEDRKLAFITPPGTAFEYSGEGFEYVARFAEEKLDKPFESLVKDHLLEPLGMASASLSVRPENFPRIARALDDNGSFPGYYCRPNGWCRKEGDVSVAGSMVITVNDYADFLISTMDGKGLGRDLLLDRNTIQGRAPDIDCSQNPDLLCPTEVGYGLGWNILRLASDRVIGHRGSDWSTVSAAYYYEKSRDGLVIFLNAPNRTGIAAMVDLLELLDPRSPELHGYRARRARAEQ